MEKIYSKKFSELKNMEILEIFKARFEIFCVEQKITIENEIDKYDKTAEHVFIKKKNCIVAYLRFYKYQKSKIKIGRVLVMKDHRKQGYAIKLLSYAINKIKKQYPRFLIILTAQSYVQKMYESLGFIPISKIYNEVENVPSVDMILKK